MATVQAKHLYYATVHWSFNSIHDLSFALFCCDCLNTKFVRIMVHIERIMVHIERIIGTLERIIGKNSENCRIE